jgi:hypothetical protein
MGVGVAVACKAGSAPIGLPRGKSKPGRGTAYGSAVPDVAV